MIPVFPVVGEFFTARPLFSSAGVELQNTLIFASGITAVPLGRTEILVVPNDAPSRELSQGQGLGGARFDGAFTS